jgi:fucose 4-O-acetylase-like acetyltransferase
MLGLSYINSVFFPKFWLPLNLNVVLAAIPLFFSGFAFRRIQNVGTINFVSVLIAISSLLAIIQGIKLPYNMKGSSYGIPVISFISAISVILVLIMIAQKITAVKFLSVPLIKLGDASMVIMYLHQPLQILLMQYFLVNGEFIRFFASTAIAFGIYLVLGQFTFGRAIFLGSYSDYLIISGWMQKNVGLFWMSRGEN